MSALSADGGKKLIRRVRPEVEREEHAMQAFIATMMGAGREPSTLAPETVDLFRRHSPLYALLRAALAATSAAWSAPPDRSASRAILFRAWLPTRCSSAVPSPSMVLQRHKVPTMPIDTRSAQSS
jgi:hypothetical protein